MCYTCGCKRPYDQMGDPDNVTEEIFKKAGETDAIGKEGVLAAKKNLFELLKEELEKNELEKPQEQY